MVTESTFDSPLASDGVVPILWGTYAACFQLESLLPEDEPRFVEAHAEIANRLGDQLKWSWATPFPTTQRFSLTDFEMVDLRCRQLGRKGGVGSPEIYAKMGVTSVSRFFLAAHGGAKENEASPYGYRYFSEVPELGSSAILPTQSALTVTVPVSMGVEEFEQMVLRIGSLLRCRWAAAGYGYAGWKYTQHNATRDAIFAHSKRFHGFDVGLESGWMPDFHRRIRSVSWLTFVGPELLAELGGAAALSTTHPEVSVQPTANGAWLKASATPAICDINRLQISPAYLAVDALLRKVRASNDLNFAHPWSEKTTEDWLRRFERRLS